MFKQELELLNSIFEENAINSCNILQLLLSTRKIIEEISEYEKYKKGDNYNHIKYCVPNRSDPDINTTFDNIIKSKLRKNIKFLIDCCFHSKKNHKTTENKYFTDLINFKNKDKENILIKLKTYWSCQITILYDFWHKLGLKQMPKVDDFLDAYLEAIKGTTILLPDIEMEKMKDDDIVGFSYGDSREYARGNLGRNLKCFFLIRKDGDRYEL